MEMKTRQQHLLPSAEPVQVDLCSAGFGGLSPKHFGGVCEFKTIRVDVGKPTRSPRVNVPVGLISLCL